MKKFAIKSVAYLFRNEAFVVVKAGKMHPRLLLGGELHAAPQARESVNQ